MKNFKSLFTVMLMTLFSMTSFSQGVHGLTSASVGYGVDALDLSADYNVWNLSPIVIGVGYSHNFAEESSDWGYLNHSIVYQENESKFYLGARGKYGQDYRVEALVGLPIKDLMSVEGYYGWSDVLDDNYWGASVRYIFLGDIGN